MSVTIAGHNSFFFYYRSNVGRNELMPSDAIVNRPVILGTYGRITSSFSFFHMAVNEDVILRTVPRIPSRLML